MFYMDPPYPFVAWNASAEEAQAAYAKWVEERNRARRAFVREMMIAVGALIAMGIAAAIAAFVMIAS
jgi:hypothetical protein